MKLTLAWRDRDVLDVELHLWRKRDDETDDAPRLEASGGGQAERASTYGDPAAIVRFGFSHIQHDGNGADPTTTEGRR